MHLKRLFYSFSLAQYLVDAIYGSCLYYYPLGEPSDCGWPIFFNCHIHFCLCIEEKEPSFLDAVHSPCRKMVLPELFRDVLGASIWAHRSSSALGGTSFARQDDSLYLKGELLHWVTGLQVSCGRDTLVSWSWLTFANESSQWASLPNCTFRDVSNEYQQTLQTSLCLVKQQKE